MIPEQEFSRLKSVIDPFQEGPNGDRLKALGLKRLYTQMADPTFEQLRQLASTLVSMPVDHIRELRYATLNAGHDPKYYFGSRNIPIEDQQAISAGAGNVGHIVDEIEWKFDGETNELRWGETLDVDTIVHDCYEQILVNKAERELRDATRKVHDEPDLRRRAEGGGRLKTQVQNYIGRHNFTFHGEYDRNESLDPTWDILTSASRLSILLETGHNTISGGFGIQEAVRVAEAAIRRNQLERRLQKLPPKDQERFEELRSRFGAKAANLILLSERVKSINRLRERKLMGTEIAVPEFLAVPIDHYRSWKEGQPIEGDLLPYYKWASRLKKGYRYDPEKTSADYMVRSSAVFSEDGETVTGAGIYGSVRVYGGSSFDQFMEAVNQVYRSTDSPKAQAYRAEHGIDTEEMGLVIQRYAEPMYLSMHHQSFEGYVNSRLSGISSLMEIATETSRNFIKRDELDFFLGLIDHHNHEMFLDIHHFPPDQYKARPEMLIMVSQLTAILERIWGRDIQAEFVVNGSTVNFVQVRELPADAMSPATEINFPDEEPVHQGSSVGIGDMELEVLDAEDDNSEKVGVTVFGSNYQWSMENNSPRLPKKGAVIIAVDGGRNGHIQTLCVEKGLVCIFPDKNADEFGSRFPDLENLKKIRVVSNGIEGRIYPVPTQHLA